MPGETEELAAFLNNYARVDKQEMKQAAAIVEEVKIYARTFLKDQLPEWMRVWAFEGVGSTSEKVKAICADEFDVLLPIKLKGYKASLINEQKLLDRVVKSPGYCWVFIKRTNPECEGIPEEGYVTEDGFLSPAATHRKFRDILNQFIDKRENHEYEIRPDTNSPAIVMRIEYKNMERTLKIKMVPAIVVEGQWLIAQPHPQAQNMQSCPEKLLWMKSYPRLEREKFRSLRLRGYLSEGLIIMKAVRCNYPKQLGMITSYILKTIWLHFIDDHIRNVGVKENVDHTLKAFIVKLCNELSTGSIHPFCDNHDRSDYNGCNLLESCDQNSLDSAIRFLRSNPVRNLIMKPNISLTALTMPIGLRGE